MLALMLPFISAVAHADDALIIWEKPELWASLSQDEPPPDAVSALTSLHLEMGRDEYESAAFVISNQSALTRSVALSVSSAHLGITLRKGVWVTTYASGSINDALSRIDDHTVAVEPGESLEIWRKALGPEHPDVWTALNNMGNLLRIDCTGDISETNTTLGE